MSEMVMWKRVVVAILCGFAAACGSVSSGSDPNAQPTVNNPPQIDGAPAAVAMVDRPYIFAPVATDADGDVLTFKIENRPDWATFSPITGTLEGTPPVTANPVYRRILISVSDGKAISELSEFDLQIAGLPPANTPPAIGGTPAGEVVAGNSYEFIPQVSDPDGQTLVLSVTGKPPWAQFDAITGRLSGTPAATDVGTYRGVTISVSDGVEQTALPAFDIVVSAGTVAGPTNRPPVISGVPAGAVAAGQAYSFQPVASDPDGQALTFSITGKPGWANFNTSTGQLSGTPTTTDIGPFPNVTITVSDGAASATLPGFSITVIANNNPPDISGVPPTDVVAGQAYSFRPTAVDPDGQRLVFAAANKPRWSTFNTTTGRLSGTPTEADAGTYPNVSISVTDGAAQDALPPFTIVVSMPNKPPVISGTPATSVTVGQGYSFTPTASDPDGQTLGFTIANKPSWATFNSSTGRLSGTPAAADARSYSGIVITVSDGTDSAVLPGFTLTVEAAPNRPPVISGTPATSVTVGQGYSFTPTASDPDGQTLGFTIANKPSWATFNSSTGRLSGTPAAADARSYSGIVITVSDGTDSAVLPGFTLTVEAAPNRPPVISGTPATSVTVGQGYSFTPTASDPDGQTLGFTIANKPSWATFNSSTGRLSGTPAAADARSYSGIVITVSDGTDSAVLPGFTLTVEAAPNRPPVISGTPATSVTVGQGYSFTPTASDPDGQTLGFTIANKPSWATFNSSTGRLSGTPAAADAGTYPGIVITVSDGTDSAVLPGFTLTVQQIQLGSVTLAWTPPTQNTDQSALTDLKGYRVKYGTSAANLNLAIDLPNPGITSVMIEDLAPGTWYFAMSAYNTSNVESDLSNVTSKVIK